jgi:hydrogenase maturation factor
MCLGEITRLLEAWEDGGARVGRLADGSVVPLAFVPDATPGSSLLVHLGVPVEVLDDEVAAEALTLRTTPAVPIDVHGGSS